MIDVALLGTGGTLPLARPVPVGGPGPVRRPARADRLRRGHPGQPPEARLGAQGRRHHPAHPLPRRPRRRPAGLLLTIGNSGRTRDEPLTVAGPRGVQRVVESLRVIAPHLPYPVRYRELAGDPADSLAVGPLGVTAARADHDIPCLAYRLSSVAGPRLPARAGEGPGPAGDDLEATPARRNGRTRRAPRWGPTRCSAPRGPDWLWRSSPTAGRPGPSSSSVRTPTS